jgi:protein-S-isoprenylcysteine O-methyltransferase Ste14
MSKVIATIYGVIVYLFFLLVFLYAIGFVGNYLVPKSIDSGTESDMASSVIINLALLGLFAIQHSLMARPFFKNWWKRIVPTAVERTTFVLFASLLLALTFWQWQPLKGVVWQVDQPLGRLVWQAASFLGWFTVLLTTFMTNHFDLFGLRQIYLNMKGKTYSQLPFTTRFLYNFVRHPLMLGFIIAFWATPDMTVGHLIFALATTGYILIAIQLEERDMLISQPEYRQYRRQVSMLVPLPGKKQAPASTQGETVKG